jgi:hypothetical protein
VRTARATSPSFLELAVLGKDLGKACEEVVSKRPSFSYVCGIFSGATLLVDVGPDIF